MDPKFDAYAVDVLWKLEEFGYPALVAGSPEDGLSIVLGTSINNRYLNGMSSIKCAVIIWAGAMNAHKNLMKGVTVH